MLKNDSLNSHTIKVADIANRTIKCTCGKEMCRIGIYFDSDPNTLRLWDKDGDGHTMPLTKEIAQQLIEHLKPYTKS